MVRKLTRASFWLAFIPEKYTVQVSGFTVYVSPSIAPRARDRLEQVCRYGIRPPIATERLHLTPSGNVLYRFKKPWKDGTHSILLEPLAFIERLAALLPPPRRHLLTYHGMLAPAARCKERVVPGVPQEEEALIRPRVGGQWPPRPCPDHHQRPSQRAAAGCGGFEIPIRRQRRGPPYQVEKGRLGRGRSGGLESL